MCFPAHFMRIYFQITVQYPIKELNPATKTLANLPKTFSLINLCQEESSIDFLS